MASANILNLTQENFAQEVLQSSTPVLVDFWAPWCSPCRALTPILDDLAEEYSGRVKVGKVNTDEQQELAAQYRINSIPALLLFRQGQVADQINGLHSKRDLKTKIDRTVGEASGAPLKP
ncbi:Thioredoxin-1 [Verrucomicrobia bacterium]|nr:Thioredoxin-1 [Verrucomicrobiota bacterium]